MATRFEESSCRSLFVEQPVRSVSFFRYKIERHEQIRSHLRRRNRGLRRAAREWGQNDQCPREASRNRLYRDRFLARVLPCVPPVRTPVARRPEGSSEAEGDGAEARGVKFDLFSFAIGKSGPSDSVFTHTVTVVSEAEVRDAWPRMKRATMNPDFGPTPDFALEIDLSCPKCGAAPKEKRISESEVEFRRHGRVRCLLARVRRALRSS